MENENRISALNSLIVINNDRIEGYETASKETDAADLKGLFSDLQSTSNDNLSELRAEVAALGGVPDEGTRTTGKFFRVWMDTKAALTGGNRHGILSSCEFGEDKALEAYEEVLEKSDSGLTADELSMIREQKSNLTADHDKVKALRDAAA